jgi:hypothetical protein
MKKIIRNIRLYIARFQVLDVVKAIELDLKFSRNIHGDEINHTNARSWWTNTRGRMYRVQQVILPEQTYNIVHKQTGRTIYGAWIEPFCWCWNEVDSITGFTHATNGDFLKYKLHPEYLVKIQKANVI